MLSIKTNKRQNKRHAAMAPGVQTFPSGYGLQIIGIEHDSVYIAIFIEKNVQEEHKSVNVPKIRCKRSIKRCKWLYKYPMLTEPVIRKICAT